MSMVPKITIIKVRRGDGDNVNNELQWVGNSLGLFNLRDRDSSCFRIFISLVKTARRNEHLSSDLIADRLNLTRGTVVHHLNKLMESGIVIRERNIYHLRGDSVQDVIAHVERTMNKALEDLKQTAEEIDKSMRR